MSRDYGKRPLYEVQWQLPKGPKVVFERASEGACHGLSTSLFFPAQGENKLVHEAKKVCAGCVVREECLEFALAADIKFGIFGGTSEKQRRQMRRRRAA